MTNIDKFYFRIGQINDGVALVKRFHYSHRAPGNIQFVGTFHINGGLFGDFGPAIAAIFFSSPPTRWSEDVLELSRLVRHNDYSVPLTRLIALSCNSLRKRGFDLLVSFADSSVGHHGGIYQACSWNYDGKRSSSMDGLIINGCFVPGRTCNSLYNTRSPKKLKEIKPTWDIEPHYDTGKYLYWRALSRSGEKKAKKLGLNKITYPKPGGRGGKERI